MSVYWKDTFRIGIATIDDQHRELFYRLDELENALRAGKGSETVISTFQFLDSYAQLHFTAEEKLQALYKYPHMAMHVAEHAVFRKRLKELQEQLVTEDPSERLAAHTHMFLTQWLITHVTSLDKELTAFFNEARTKEWEEWLLSRF